MDRNIFSFTAKEANYIGDILRDLYAQGVDADFEDELLGDFISALDNADVIEISEEDDDDDNGSEEADEDRGVHVATPEDRG